MARSRRPARFRRWLLIGACALLAASAAPAADPVRVPAPAFVLTDSGSALAARKAAVQRALAGASALYEGAGKDVQAAAAAYATANAELPGARADLATANGVMIAARVNSEQADAVVTAAQGLVAAANATVVDDNKRVIAQQAAISDVVTSVYQGSALLGLDSLLTDGSPGDVLNRFGLASELVDDQRRTLKIYLQARQTATLDLATASDAAARAVAAQADAQTALQRSVAAVAGAQKASGAVDTLVAQRAAALAGAQKHKASVLADYDQLKKENDEITAQLKALAEADRHSGSGKKPRTPAPSGRSGYFIMPIHGWKSSNFGMRFDPIYRRWQLHAGVDIADPGGTPIHAARAGRVVRAGWFGGYGNYTCVDTGLYAGAGADHGKEIANCYGHQSRIMVHVGQHVRTGQMIGLVGETGAATGYHLHFEVRINGTPVQPLNWLPACFC